MSTNPKYGVGYRQPGSQPAQIGIQNGQQDTYEDLVNVLAAKQNMAKADRIRAGAHSYPGWGGVFSNAFSTNMAERAEDEAIEQATQAARSEQDKLLLEEAKGREEVFKYLKANTDMDDEQALYTAKMVMAGHVDLGDLGMAGLSDKDRFDITDKILDDSKKDLEFSNTAEREMHNLNQIINQGYESGSAQVGALYSLVKGLDPGSVVREGEVQLAQQAESIIGMMQKLTIKAQGAGVMSPAMFEDLVGFVDELNLIQRESARRGMQTHVDRAANFGFEPKEVWGQAFQDKWEAGIVDASALREDKGAEKTYTLEEAVAAVEAGELKQGDTFIGDDGEEYTVP